MNIFHRIGNAYDVFVKTKNNIPDNIPNQQKKRSYDGAKQNNQTSDWLAGSDNANAEIRAGLDIVRRRARDLIRNNPYAKKYVTTMIKNVVGHKGIKFQSRYKTNAGNPDKRINSLLEDDFNNWQLKKNCTVCGKYNWRQVQVMCIQALVSDGEFLARRVRSFKNEHGYALQILESDHLDLNLNTTLPNGNRIIMGIEIDSWGKPINYHILASHPGDYTRQTVNGKPYYILPAEDVLHIFIPERPEQVRGVPPLHTVMTALRMLKGYSDAELNSARVAACQMGFLIKENNIQGFTSDVNTENNPDNPDEENIINVEPGIFTELPAGTKVQEFLPNSPPANHGMFMKTGAREVASGLEMSYNILANDHESVNFASQRIALADTHDTYRMKQQILIEELCEPIFEDYLLMSILKGRFGSSSNSAIGMTKYDALIKSTTWQARGFTMVNPIEEVKAAILKIENFIGTRTDYLAEYGEDFEEVASMLGAEEKALKTQGLKLKESPQKESKGGTQNAI